MKGRMLQGLRYLQRFIDRPWYPPLLGLVCAVDLLIVVIPLDPLLFSSCLLRPRSWWRIFLSMTIGAILGAFVVATIAQHDPTFVPRHFHALSVSPTWHYTQEHLRSYGIWGLILLGLSPVPQVFPVLVAALGGIPALEVALTLGIGRALKYGVYSYLTAHAPHLLRKVPGLGKMMQQLETPR